MIVDPPEVEAGVERVLLEEVCQLLAVVVEVTTGGYWIRL